MGAAHKVDSRVGRPHLDDGTGRAEDVFAELRRARVLPRKLDDLRLVLRIGVRVVLQTAQAIGAAREALCHARQGLELENGRRPRVVGELHPTVSSAQCK